MMQGTRAALVVGGVLLIQPAAAQSPIRTCDSLASLSLPNATVTMTVESPAHDFWSAQGDGEPAGDATLCRVAATLTPSSDSNIAVEVWLPLDWNGKFQVTGGAIDGALGGSIDYSPMLTAVQAGYATAGHNSGHEGLTLSFAPDHPEQLVDYGHRAVHEMTVFAKEVIAAFYGLGPRYSYWNACAAGGREGWQEVQRYPADYDGLVVIDPANYWTHLQTWSLWMWQATHETPESYIPPEKYSVIHDAVIDRCDALDGVADGVLEDPRRCEFDPQVLACTAGDAPGCLTPAQVTAARKIYAPATNPRTNAEIFPGLMPGSEMGWGSLAGRTPLRYAIETFRYVVFDDPIWSAETSPIDFDVDVARADDTGAVINANNADLQPFFDRGGKIIAAAGWNDPLISPLNSVRFHERVIDTVGHEQVEDAYRLYMVPGIMHCGGGDGTDSFDLLSELERWVEEGVAPTRINASRIVDGEVERTRPLCPYPQVAVYTGTGSTDEAANFVCREAPAR